MATSSSTRRLGGAAAWPVVARAQQGNVPVIGYLSARSLEADASGVAAIRRGLAERGLIDGHNVSFEYRYADYRLERLPELASDLVRRQVAVIFAVPTPAALAAKAATKTIPIVFAVGVDPVQTGLVGSLAHPGSNVTGTSTMNGAVAAKRFQMLHELLPSAESIAYIANPTNAAFTEPEKTELQTAANTLGVRLLVLSATHPDEFEPAFATLVGHQAQGLVVSSESLFIGNAPRLVALADRHRVPAVYPNRRATAIGGLMSYGAGLETSAFSTNRQGLIYIDRILKGEKPADLPVQQSTRIELIINLKTAKALGLTMPETLLATADEVIQ